jgi:oligopeptide transport system substrate-binding protein
LGPITLVVVVLLASLIPAVMVYRRRERSAGIADSDIQPLVLSPADRE